MIKCSICGKEIEERYSCNAYPVTEERCCHDCDRDVVIPARFIVSKPIDNRIIIRELINNGTIPSIKSNCSKFYK